MLLLRCNLGMLSYWSDSSPLRRWALVLLLCYSFLVRSQRHTTAAFQIPENSSWIYPPFHYHHPRWVAISDSSSALRSQHSTVPILPSEEKKPNPWTFVTRLPSKLLHKKSWKLILYFSFLLDISIALFGARHLMGGGLSAFPSTIRTWCTIVVHSLQQIRQSKYVLRRTIGAALLLTLLYDHFQTYRRQRIDPTSEWQRYAQYPALRGWAITKFLLLQILPSQFYVRFVARHKDACQMAAGHVFAQGLLQLGPLYIKIGQILSCRAQVLPSQWQNAMERLQDQVPAQTGAAAQALAYAGWPGGARDFQETFEQVDWTPLAAASLGQVHRAVLKSTGDPVALKLQRPYLRTIYDNDFRLLTKMAQLVDRFFAKTAGSVGGISQSWTTIFADAEDILYREIDYRAEAENAMRFARDFGLTRGGAPANVTCAVARDGKPLASAASWLRTPYVYDALTTEQVLVMEYVPSIKVTATHKLRFASVTEADREYLADCLGRSYLRQFCCNKFCTSQRCSFDGFVQMKTISLTELFSFLPVPSLAVSTDPHAGNLGVEILNMKSTNPEERVRLVYYDFGQAAELEQNQADGILDIIEAIVDMDVDKSITSFQKMGVLKDHADLHVVRQKVADNYRTGKVKANQKKLRKKKYKFKDDGSFSVDTTPLVSSSSTDNASVSDAQVMQYFTLPAEYAFVGRAISQMDGVGKILDPEFDFVSAAAPWIYEIKGATTYVQEEIRKWIDNLRDGLSQQLFPSNKAE
jgi:predicted unusual protein kinase regulating ubiquinone biosynthesis (AarF/ABC1/UbiB family)